MSEPITKYLRVTCTHRSDVNGFLVYDLLDAAERLLDIHVEYSVSAVTTAIFWLVGNDLHIMGIRSNKQEQKCRTRADYASGILAKWVRGDVDVGNSASIGGDIDQGASVL